MDRTVSAIVGSLCLAAPLCACGGGGNPTPPPDTSSTAMPEPNGDTTAPTNENVAALPFDNGWVARDGNTVGIQGSFYTFSDVTDGGTSSIAPEDFSMSGSESICATGQAAQVINGEYSTYWGASVGFNLSQEENDDTAYPWDSTAQSVTGFGFVVDQLPVGGQLRFNLKASNDTSNYCGTIRAEGYNEFRFADLAKSCWTSEEGTPDYTALEALHWQFVTNESASYDFSLCVSDLVALLD